MLCQAGSTFKLALCQGPECQGHTTTEVHGVLSFVLGVKVTKKIILIPAGESLVLPRRVSGVRDRELRCGTMTPGKENRIFDG